MQLLCQLYCCCSCCCSCSNCGSHYWWRPAVVIVDTVGKGNGSDVSDVVVLAAAVALAAVVVAVVVVVVVVVVVAAVVGVAGIYCSGPYSGPHSLGI